MANLRDDLNAAVGSGAPPAVLASLQGHAGVVRLLGELGADLNVLHLLTPMHVASYRGHLEVLMVVYFILGFVGGREGDQSELRNEPRGFFVLSRSRWYRRRLLQSQAIESLVLNRLPGSKRNKLFDMYFAVVGKRKVQAQILVDDKPLAKENAGSTTHFLAEHYVY